MVRLRNAAPALAVGGGGKGEAAPAVRAVLSAYWPAVTCVRSRTAFHWRVSVTKAEGEAGARSEPIGRCRQFKI